MIQKIDTVLASSQQTTVQSVDITGNINALVIPVGFSDKSGTQSLPTLTNNTYFPVLGVDTNGILLSDLITENGGSLPEDQWYKPAFDHYFSAESGGKFNLTKKTTC